MKKLSKGQLGAILGAIILGVLIYFLPHSQSTSGVVQHQAEETTKPLTNDQKLAKAAEILNSGQNPMEGIQLLREVVADDPENVEAHFQLGIRSIQSGQFDKAIERFSTVVKLSPEVAEGYYYLAYAYQQAGKSSDALTAYEKVLALSSDDKLKAEVINSINDIKSKQ